jgi:hypothetical protein
MDIPANGALEEFERKRVRDDYALYALWEMGAASFRLPLQDLLDGHTRKRIRRMSERGQSFVLYCYGVPDGGAAKGLAENTNLVRALEIATRPDRLEPKLAGIASLKKTTGTAIRPSFMRTGRGDEGQSQYKHTVDHGFLPDEAEQVAALFSRPEVRANADGVVFRVNLDSPPLESLTAICEIVKRQHISASVSGTDSTTVSTIRGPWRRSFVS